MALSLSKELQLNGVSNSGQSARRAELLRRMNMKSLPILSVVLLLLCTGALAQSHEMNAIDKDKPVPTEAQKSFNTMKTFAGTWHGQVTVDPPMKEMDNADMEVSMRVTSRGNALVHEMKGLGQPDDPAKYDHPVTMFYLDNDRLLLTHYCDAGNRPRMAARTSPDGKTVEFDFVDIAGNTKYGHMEHAVFTAVDANHHVEDWTFLMPGNKAMHAHFDLKRAQ
jgi:hypothetical protein